MAKATRETAITPQQAAYVVDQLIKSRRISPQEVARLASGMENEIAEIERKLALWRPMSSRASGRSRSRQGAATGKRRSSGPVSPEAAASRKLQGEYMGLLRYRNAADKARFKKMAAERGRDVAVREMRKAGGG